MHRVTLFPGDPPQHAQVDVAAQHFGAIVCSSYEDAAGAHKGVKHKAPRPHARLQVGQQRRVVYAVMGMRMQLLSSPGSLPSHLTFTHASKPLASQQCPSLTPLHTHLVAHEQRHLSIHAGGTQVGALCEAVAVHRGPAGSVEDRASWRRKKRIAIGVLGLQNVRLSCTQLQRRTHATRRCLPPPPPPTQHAAASASHDPPSPPPPLLLPAQHAYLSLVATWRPNTMRLPTQGTPRQRRSSATRQLNLTSG